MKTKAYILLSLLAVFILSSCYPEERFWWSSKGDRAVVLISDKLYLSNADGELGAPILGDKPLGQLSTWSVCWIPDGTGFVFLRSRIIKTWEEACKLIPTEEVNAVDQTLPLVMPLLEAATKLKGTENTLVSGADDALEQIMSLIPKGKLKAFGVAIQRKFAQAPGEVEKLLLALPHGSEFVEGLKKEDAGFEIAELCVHKLEVKNEAEPRVLARSLLHSMAMPKVSPKHAFVAFLKSDESDKSASLEVLPLNGGPGLTVASQISAAYDWMSDGRSLVFMVPFGEGEKLQSIHRITVVQEAGALMKSQTEKQSNGSFKTMEGPDRIKAPTTLATAIMLNHPTLQALSDGRILFACQPATLPAVETGAELDPRLYLIAADGKTLQTIPTAPGDIPVDLGYFIASPDAKHIALVESETDAVAVVDVDTGKTEIISPPHPRWQCRTLPAWKSTTELTFAALQGTEPKWMLWSPGIGIRSISGKWPATATSDWLEQKHDDESKKKTEAPIGQ